MDQGSCSPILPDSVKYDKRVCKNLRNYIIQSLSGLQSDEKKKKVINRRFMRLLEPPIRTDWAKQDERPCHPPQTWPQDILRVYIYIQGDP